MNKIILIGLAFFGTLAGLFFLPDVFANEVIQVSLKDGLGISEVIKNE